MPFCVYCRRLGHLKEVCERLQAKHRRQERFQKYRLQQNTPTEYGFLKDEARNTRFNDDDDFGGYGFLKKRRVIHDLVMTMTLVVA